ncbi:MAG: hypothetical protein JNM28_10140 [Armatimonadetes bacterium]|nr:hypothetical protein [Armatimonadota bacterium]
MIAAVMAVSAIAQSGPVERLVQFLNAADRRGITFSATAGAYRLTAKLSYAWPDQQMAAFSMPEGKVDFYQQGHRVLLANHASKAYYEYETGAKMSPPPPEASFASDLYPGFLWSFRKIENLKKAKPDGKSTIQGVECDWIKMTEQSMEGPSSARFAIGPDGMLMRAEIQQPQNPLMTFEFTEYTWPYFDISAWVYQPPVGYVLGNAPKVHYPPTTGAKLNLKSWKGADFAGLNKGGLAILVTAEGGNPDNLIVKDAPALAATLKGLGVALVEVHLDGPAPKRKWTAVADPSGAIEGELDIPVTPYIFYVGRDGAVISGWAGYAPDQKEKLLKSARDAFAGE